MKSKFGQLIIAAFIGGVVAVVSVLLVHNGPKESVTTVHSVDTVPAIRTMYTQNSKGEMVPMDFTGVSKDAMPAVVNIKSMKMQQAYGGSSQGGYNDMLRRFFSPDGQQQGRRESTPVMGVGSGVIISEDGYIATNNHVIEGADKLEVTLLDNRTYEAEVIGTDPSTDIAVIRIKDTNLPFLRFVDSDNVEIGEWVLAIGNPLGTLTNTVTAGIVSAKGRSIGILGSNGENSETPDPDQYNTQGNPNWRINNSIESFIQTDAAINPGNSGGALVNLEGALVGINTAIASRTGSYTGYGFAVPANIVSKVSNDLIKYGTVQRGVLGVIILSVNSDLAKEKNLDMFTGVYIDQVGNNSGAAEAGVEAGDVISEVDGINVRNTAELQEIIGRRRPGDKVTLTLVRGDDIVKAEVTLKNRDGNTEIVKKSSNSNLLKTLGVSFEDIDDNLAEKLEIRSGVRVTDITQGVIYSHTKIKDGFIITKIDGKMVKDSESLIQYLESKRGDGVMVEGVYEQFWGTYYAAFGIPE